MKSRLNGSVTAEIVLTARCLTCLESASDDLRQGSFTNSVTNFVIGFPYIFQRETQPSFGDLLLVIARRRYVTRF